jgi:ParB family chromosome partitioning protein
MIHNIPINQLHPHPDNPRKDLGDLSELAASIKQNGVLQNLTVVPRIIGSKTDYPSQDGYRVIIGHRRLAAAKLAGLTELHCVISDMDEREQISTMLLENMQRSDLTIYEQALGFQMMLDFGETFDSIVTHTGFSENTVRRRIKLLKLDANKFKESVERGGTLQDYAELDKIDDNKVRNKVLESIGTANFRWELNNAIENQKTEIKKAELIAELEQWATLMDANADRSNLDYVKNLWKFNLDGFQRPADANASKEIYFYVVEGTSITLYKKRAIGGQQKPNVDPKQEERRERNDALSEVARLAYRLRYDFVREYTPAKAKKNASIIMEYAARIFVDNYGCCDLENIIEFLGMELPEETELNYSLIADKVADEPEWHLLIIAYLSMDSAGEEYHDHWNGEYVKNENLDMLYDFLEKLGYEVSDEERALKDGTHELFTAGNEGGKQ